MYSVYTYNGNQYRLQNSVRRAIFITTRKQVLGEEPINYEDKVAFWQNYGVTYEEFQEPDISLNTLKEAKLNELDQIFLQWYNDKATLISSLGFEIDCDSRANTDIDGLVIIGESAMFMDAHNVSHFVTLDQLKILQQEIKKAGVEAYNTKWNYRNNIYNAQDKEALENIQLIFTPVNFSVVE